MVRADVFHSVCLILDAKGSSGRRQGPWWTGLTKYFTIQLLEYTIPPPPPPPARPPSQKPSPGDVSVTKSGIIDPLVSKRPETNSEIKI